MRKTTGIATALLILVGGAGNAAASAATSAETGAVPVGLERFYEQEPVWTGCSGFATTDADREALVDPKLQCTRVQVPLDYSQPGGRTARIGLLRVPAQDPAQRIGSLLINPGGPGEAGMSRAAAMAGAVAGTEVGRRFDLVGFDPRGVAATEPAVHCRSTAEMDAERLDNDPDTSPAEVARTEAEERAYAQQCAARSGLDLLANVGTRDAARDLDVLRAVLGDKKLTYLGYSYGSELGTEYAEQFPRNVRAMVLDGTVDPAWDTVEQQTKSAEAQQKMFDAFARWCVEQPRCWLGEASAEQANDRLDELAAPLVEHPLPVGQRRLSATDVGTASMTYSDADWPELNQALIELADGDGRRTIELADSQLGRAEHGYSNAGDSHTAIECADNPAVTDPAATPQEHAPAPDDPVSAARDVCAFWPVPATSRPHRPDADGLAPVLVISTTGDPATPYEGGVNLARELNGRLLTFEGTQHTAHSLDGESVCVDDAVSTYLIDLTLPPDGQRCAR